MQQTSDMKLLRTRKRRRHKCYLERFRGGQKHQLGPWNTVEIPNPPTLSAVECFRDPYFSYHHVTSSQQPTNKQPNIAKWTIRTRARRQKSVKIEFRWFVNRVKILRNLSQIMPRTEHHILPICLHGNNNQKRWPDKNQTKEIDSRIFRTLMSTTNSFA